MITDTQYNSIINKYKTTLSNDEKNNMASTIGNVETSVNNASTLYGQLGKETPADTSGLGGSKAGIIDNILKPASDFLMKTVIGAPNRVVLRTLADAWSAITGKAVGDFDTPFGKVRPLYDKQGDQLTNDVVASVADSVSTLITALGNGKYINTPIANKFIKTPVDIALNTAKDTTIGAISGAASGYAENESTRDATMGAIWGGAASGIFSLGSQLVGRISTNMVKGQANKAAKIENATTDNLIKFYKESDIGTNPMSKEAFYRRRGLEYGTLATNGAKINNYDDYVSAVNKGINQWSDEVAKLNQSADDAGTLLGFSKTSVDDITNLNAISQTLAPADKIKFDDLLEKAQSGIITVSEGDELVRLAQTNYEVINSTSLKKAIDNFRQDLHGTVKNYWASQGVSSDIIDTAYEAKAAFTETKKMLGNIQATRERIVSAVRQGKTGEAVGLLDTLYNSALGIKSKPRVILTILQNIKNGTFQPKEIDDLIADGFKYLNNNTLNKQYADLLSKTLNTTKGLEIEVPKVKTTPTGADDFAKDITAYSDKIKAGDFVKENIPAGKSIPPDLDRFPGQGTPIMPETVNKASAYQEVYNTMSKKQLSAQYTSLQKELANMIRKQTGTAKKLEIDAIKEQLDVLEEIIAGK